MKKIAEPSKESNHGMLKKKGAGGSAKYSDKCNIAFAGVHTNKTPTE